VIRGGGRGGDGLVNVAAGQPVLVSSVQVPCLTSG
jgi:hypothetical protein